MNVDSLKYLFALLLVAFDGLLFFGFRDFDPFLQFGFPAMTA